MGIVEGFVIGLFGSLHCVGMCGPLALALPLPTNSVWQKVVGALLYNIGRAVTYGMLGLIFGFVGAGLKHSGVQEFVSILCGSIMILSVVLPGIIKLPKGSNKVSHSIYSTLKKKIGDSLNRQKVGNLFVIGILNGFLPCGLVYVAISKAVLSLSIQESVLSMFFFGLGTLPMMFTVAFFSNIIRHKYLHKLKVFMPVFIIILGIIFILRGLNLGIPYISPDMSKAACCH